MAAERPGRDVGAIWGYLGVGCLTFFAGAAGGAMTSVLIAKVAGVVRNCAPDRETGAPCGWYTFAVWGALLGALLLPTAVLWRIRQGRGKSVPDVANGNSTRG
jgi:hypothetical protein